MKFSYLLNVKCQHSTFKEQKNFLLAERVASFSQKKK